MSGPYGHHPVVPGVGMSPRSAPLRPRPPPPPRPPLHPEQAFDATQDDMSSADTGPEEGRGRGGAPAAHPQLSYPQGSMPMPIPVAVPMHSGAGDSGSAVAMPPAEADVRANDQGST